MQPLNIVATVQLTCLLRSLLNGAKGKDQKVMLTFLTTLVCGNICGEDLLDLLDRYLNKFAQRQ